MIISKIAFWRGHKYTCPKCNRYRFDDDLLFQSCVCGNSHHVDIKAWFRYCFNVNDEIPVRNISYGDTMISAMFIRIDERQEDAIKSAIAILKEYIDQNSFKNNPLLVCIDQIKPDQAVIPMANFIEDFQTLSILLQKLNNTTATLIFYEMSPTDFPIPSVLYFTSYFNDKSLGIISKDLFKARFVSLCKIFYLSN